MERRIEEGLRPSALPLSFPGSYAQPLMSQLRQLLARDLRCYWRMPDYNATRMAISLGVALIFGSMYWMRAHRRCAPLCVSYLMQAPSANLTDLSRLAASPCVSWTEECIKVDEWLPRNRLIFWAKNCHQ